VRRLLTTFAAPMKSRPFVFATASLFLAATAVAQTTPTFTYAKPDEVKVAAVTTPPPPPPPPAVEWKAQVKGGFLMTSGNAQTTGTSVAGNVSRKEGNNRLTFDTGAAYGRSNVVNPTVVTTTDPVTMAMTNTITGITRKDIETNNNWFTKGRYDRFFTPNNSGYVSAQAAGDQVAGKTFYGGGQIGYSRQVYKSEMHLLVAELGYDLSYERYVQNPGTTHDPVTVHSARIFAGETLTLTKATGITASVEALFNLNKEGSALQYPTGTLGVDAFDDTRVNGKLGLTTTLYKRMSISFGFLLRYDQNPAPLPIPSGSPPNATFMTGFVPFADRVDTQTSATLVYTFL
jgi:hypothetical protein